MLRRYVKVLILLLVTIMSAESYDPNISNGTCWYADDEQADSAYIPCGNAAIANQTCCQARDVCLSSNACYNAQYGVTYLGGCTDWTYGDSSICPWKSKLYDQEWVGLVRCFVSNDTTAHDEEWAGCVNKNSDTEPTVQSAGGCSCNTASNTALFLDSPQLTAIASLPVKVGNAIAWYPGFSPPTPTGTSTSISVSTSVVLITRSLSGTPSISTSTSSATILVTGASTQSTATLVPSETPTVDGLTATTSSSDYSSYPDSSSTLSTGSKVGIGVGSAGGVVLIGALVIWLMMWLQRRRKANRTSQIPAIDQIRPRSPTIPYFSPEIKDEPVNGAARDAAWLSPKAELPAAEMSPSTLGTRVPSYANLSSRGSAPTNGSMYQAYSPLISEIEGSPARVASPVPRPLSTKPAYEKKVYEMPG